LREKRALRRKRAAGKVRPVKKQLLLLFACLHLCAAHAATSAGAPAKLNLLCTGWLPAYTAWETPQVPTAAQDAQLQVEIDRVAGTIATTLASTGPLTAPLEVSDRYYAGTSALGRVLFNRDLDAVEISINRVTGEARLRYMVGETGYPAFAGNCTRRMPMNMSSE
jgi:hypothetical protein